MPGTLCPRCRLRRQVLLFRGPLSVATAVDTLLLCIHDWFCVSAGTLISHEKLLLQINTEREMGNMDYKLGQVVAAQLRTEKRRKGEASFDVILYFDFSRYPSTQCG